MLVRLYSYINVQAETRRRRKRPWFRSSTSFREMNQNHQDQRQRTGRSMCWSNKHVVSFRAVQEITSCFKKRKMSSFMQVLRGTETVLVIHFLDLIDAVLTWNPVTVERGSNAVTKPSVKVRYLWPWFWQTCSLPKPHQVIFCDQSRITELKTKPQRC